MYNTQKPYPRNPLPSEVYPVAGDTLQKRILSQAAVMGGELESRLNISQESRVPRQSHKVRSKSDKDHIISRINSIRCLDPHTKKLDLKITIQERKRAYKSAPSRILIRETHSDIVYAKHFDEERGMISYIPLKNH